MKAKIISLLLSVYHQLYVYSVYVNETLLCVQRDINILFALI